MWRIFGLIFFNNKDHFVDLLNKRFNKPLLETFLAEKGVALYDTACAINRLQNNASDKFLEVVEPTDIDALLQSIPHCKAIVTTGQKATDTLRNRFNIEEPRIGESVAFYHNGKEMRLYRMPSSSRAYPLPLERKASIYKQLFINEMLL